MMSKLKKGIPEYRNTVIRTKTLLGVTGGAGERETKCGFKNLEHNPAICLWNVSYKSRNKAANNGLWTKKRTYIIQGYSM